MNATAIYLDRLKEANDISYTCRFIADKVVKYLKSDFSVWSRMIYGCAVEIKASFPKCYIMPRLDSFGLDMAVAIILRDMGLIKLGRTFGEFDAENFGTISHAVILKYGEDHREEIQAWAEKKERHNFLENPDSFEKRIIASQKEVS
jgi:phenylalanine-4-hydroxylase